MSHANFPTGIIAKGVQRYMYTEAGKRKDRRLDVDRYEVLLYRLLRRALEAGNIYVRDSNEFRSFEDDLIRPERWKNKDAVLEEIGAPVLLAPIEETLAAFHTELEGKFERVNRRIEDGDNKRRRSHSYLLYPLPLMVQFHEHHHHLQDPAHLELLKGGWGT